MRDVGLALILLVLIPMAIKRPWVGVLTWAWLSLFSPHNLTYGFMSSMPVAALSAVSIFAGLLFSKDPKELPAAPPVVWLALFTAWMCITLPFSLDSLSVNFEQWKKVMKIMGMTFVTVAVLHTRKHVDYLIGVCGLSIAFLGTKGGIFALTTGGKFQVRGNGGFIEPNNEFALALVMAVPLTYYVLQQTANKWFRRLLWVAIFMSVIAAVASNSRGGLLAIVAMGLAFLARSPSRKNLILPIIALVLFIPAFMPDAWWERMQTIGTYKEDASAMGRLNAWTVAWNVATHNLFGGGFSLETPEVFGRYAPDPSFIAVAHSIYFQILGHHGFIGIFLYLAFWVSTFRTARWIAKNSPEPADQLLGRMIEISLIGFAVGGAFLSLAYFDGPYYLMAAAVVIRYKLMRNKPGPYLPQQAAAATAPKQPLPASRPTG